MAQLVKNLPARFDPWVGKISWRRKWQHTPVFLPWKSHGQRNLVGYSPWGRRVRQDWATNRYTLCDPMDCSPPGASVHGIFQARILKRVVTPFSRGSSQPRDWNLVSFISCTGKQSLYYCSTWEAQKPCATSAKWSILQRRENRAYRIFPSKFASRYYNQSMQKCLKSKTPYSSNLLVKRQALRKCSPCQ